jgi:preprotein translocase subunit SecG
MSTFETVLLMLLVLDAIGLAALVLLQQGRGAQVGAAFGSGAANTMFGSTGSASFLTKVTVWLAIGFFVISFGLAYTAKERAARLNLIGLPQIETPAADEESAADVPSVPSDEAAGGDTAPGELTPEPEGVDSDIPDV